MRWGVCPADGTQMCEGSEREGRLRLVDALHVGAAQLRIQLVKKGREFRLEHFRSFQILALSLFIFFILKEKGKKYILASKKIPGIF